MADEEFEGLTATVKARVAKLENPTSEAISETIAQFRKLPMFETVTNSQAESLLKEIEATMDITMNLGAVLQTEFRPWLSSRKSEITPLFWDRYYKHLEQSGFPPRVVTKLDQVTDRILGLLQNPKQEGQWDRRGLVVGHVQSGKTANYTGLVCKAADAGYKLIIVIAGIHNSLRNQTQVRIDEGFVGKNSITKRLAGVGKFDTRPSALTVTTAVNDFSKEAARVVGVQLKDLKVPAILVIKKNMHTLRNLIEWLTAHNADRSSNLVHVPMLLIDDEADNASIDISADPEKASRINGQIRELLALFTRSCYVGYTATPFANIFIDPATEDEMIGEDLFPRNFIVSLDPPSNYFGATRVFLPEADEKIVQDIFDNEDLLPIKHQKEHELHDIPLSLKNAVHSFIVARVIRVLRGQENKHHSMLVNASRFIRVQSEIANWIAHYLTILQRNIRFEYAKTPEQALKNPEILKISQIFHEQFPEAAYSWEEIQSSLHIAAASIKVIVVNSQSSDSLDYAAYEEHGLHVIAVGGFSLSRGLTLEGLTISYFLRNSMMYDTLMQMGRWFGYRPGYEDLCRIWMTPDAIGWYEHISESIEELRSEFTRMEQLGLTPEQFGLKVRSHPDTLIVTARNKMRSAENIPVKIGLANSFIETYALSSNRDDIKRNLQAGEDLVKILLQNHTYEPREAGEYLWRDIPVEEIFGFLNGFQNKTGSWHTEPEPVAEYIRKRNPDALHTWDVALVSLKRGEDKNLDQSIGLDVFCQDRSIGSSSTSDCFLITEKQRVASRGAEQLGLTDQQIEASREAWRNDSIRMGRDVKNVPDWIYRRNRSKPLLIIHLLNLRIGEKKQPPEEVKVPDGPVLAWGMSFPKVDRADVTVEYTVNTTWMKSTFGTDLDEEESDNDDL